MTSARGFPDFVPATIEREVAPGIVFRPVRSWHTGVYAGENLTSIPGSDDRSGCMFHERFGGLRVACVPLSYTHRWYWRKDQPVGQGVSAFLSYPGALGSWGDPPAYFWEIGGPEDVERFDSEAEMEKRVIAVLEGAS